VLMGNMWHKTRDMNLINPLNAELNPICHLLALLGAHIIFHVSSIRVKACLSGKTPRDNASANSKGGPRTANDKRLNSCLSKNFRSLATIY